MKFYSFQIVIEKEPEDEGYFAYTPDVPGCFSNWKTIEQAKRNIREAVEQYLASLLSHGQLRQWPCNQTPSFHGWRTRLAFRDVCGLAM
jgi:predicted RNase H-like HicB family nuclease